MPFGGGGTGSFSLPDHLHTNALQDGGALEEAVTLIDSQIMSDWIRDNASEEGAAGRTAEITPSASNGKPGPGQWQFGLGDALPSINSFYRITGIVIKNGIAPIGNVRCGVCIVDAVVPVDPFVEIVAYTESIAQVGALIDQTFPASMTRPIRAGTIVKPFMITDNSGTDVEFVSAANENIAKAHALDIPSAFDSTAWGTNSLVWGISADFQGYNV